MKMLMVSKSAVVAAHHGKLQELVKLGVDLTLIVPSRWGTQQLEVTEAASYKIRVLPCWFSSNLHFHFYPTAIRSIDADIVYLEEEPWSVVTHQFMRLCVLSRKPVLFTTWQTINKRYPPPFSLFERYTFRHAQAAIAGNSEAMELLRRRGFTKPIAVIPYGVYPDVFFKREVESLRQKLGVANTFVVGYVGRVLSIKGIADLIQAFALLPSSCSLLIVGEGDFRGKGEELAQSLGVGSRIRWLPPVASLDVPDIMNAMDVLVLPSRTMSNWKEQFGRVLIEAMACETPTIGSSSGEIPTVIGDGGLVFPEADVGALAKQLKCLFDSPQLRVELGRKGRARVLGNFTQQKMAQELVNLCRIALTDSCELRPRAAVQETGKVS
jgi:glycosyltransferase involved in cell wall biosynthesis